MIYNFTFIFKCNVRTKALTLKCDFALFSTLHSYLNEMLGLRPLHSSVTLHYFRIYIHICLGLRPGSRLPCGLQPNSALKCKALDRSIYTVVVLQACCNEWRRTGHRLLLSSEHDLDPRKNSSIYLLDVSVYLTWAGPLHPLQY